MRVVGLERCRSTKPGPRRLYGASLHFRLGQYHLYVISSLPRRSPASAPLVTSAPRRRSPTSCGRSGPTTPAVFQTTRPASRSAPVLIPRSNTAVRAGVFTRRIQLRWSPLVSRGPRRRRPGTSAIKRRASPRRSLPATTARCPPPIFSRKRPRGTPSHLNQKLLTSTTGPVELGRSARPAGCVACIVLAGGFAEAIFGTLNSVCDEFSEPFEPFCATASTRATCGARAPTNTAAITFAFRACLLACDLASSAVPLASRPALSSTNTKWSRASSASLNAGSCNPSFFANNCLPPPLASLHASNALPQATKSARGGQSFFRSSRCPRPRVRRPDGVGPATTSHSSGHGRDRSNTS